MKRKLLRLLGYFFGLIILFVTGVLATAYWHRDKLMERLIAELNKDINGKVSIGKINFTFLHNFPNFSITMQDVNLHSNLFDKPGDQVLSARKVFVDVSLYPLIRQEVVINSIELENANVFVFKTQHGETNSDIFKHSADTVSNPINVPQSSTMFSIDQIDFTKVSVVYVDSTKSKVMRFQFVETENALIRSDSGYDISMAGEIHFDSLHFNEKSGSYLKDIDGSINLFAHLNSYSRTLAIWPSTNVKLKKNSIAFNGTFSLKKEGPYALQFKANNVHPFSVQELLNERLKKTLEKFKSEHLITIAVNLKGRSVPGFVPDVDLTFETRNADLRYGSLDFSKLTLNGSFTNHVDDSREKDNRNSKVVISHFKGAMEKIPLEGKVTFSQLQDPIIDLAFTSKLSHTDVNIHLDNDRFILNKGKFISKVEYKGKLSEYLDPTRTQYSGELNGTIVASDASLNYKPKKLHLDQIQMNGIFTEKRFEIKNLTASLNGSPIALSGTVKDFIPFFIQPKNKATVILALSSSNLDLTPLTTPREVKKKSKQQSEKNRKRMMELLDLVYDRLEFDVDLKVNQLTFRKFIAYNINGRVRLNDQNLEANPVSMRVAGGTMKLNFSMKNVFDPITPMVVTGAINNADIKQLFVNFNNFNQKTIHADNLRGRISADIEFSANVDEKYNLITPSMRGTLDCKIADGGLVNFEPMENMSNFLFKKRDFSDVAFAELNSSFSITGTDMDISRMEIQSSVLSFFVEGRYSFTDSTSLSVQIPLSNLKKRHKDFKPKNIGTHAKAGPSVFLHVYREKDINTKIKIDYDPFKKWVSN
jgi:uncharacterized protein involved in outer membrane biogenesis